MIIAVFCIGTGVLLLTGDVKIEVDEGSVGIEASYWGDYEVALDEIEEISYEENLNLGRRTGGLGSMRLLEGHFANEQFGKLHPVCVCEVQKLCSPSNLGRSGRPESGNS